MKKRKRIKMAPIRSSNIKKKTFIKTHTQLYIEKGRKELRDWYNSLSVDDKIAHDINTCKP
jgi:hypothetical protein